MNNMQIDEWFCTPIASFRTDNFDLTDHCLKIKDNYPSGEKEWIHQPYHTLEADGYNVMNDSKFIDLHKWVHQCVDQFSEECGYDRMKLLDAWFNVYENGDSQEFHVHPTCNVSCVYFADVREDDPRIIFNRSPFPMTRYNIKKSNRYNFNQVWYKPVNGMLLIFNSDTLHMVEKKVTDNPRITFSYNFINQ